MDTGGQDNMADENTTSAVADATVPTETTTTAPAATPPTAPAVEVAAPSKEDWAGLAKSLRTIAQALPQVAKPVEQPKAKEAPGDAAAAALAEVASLRFELGLRDAMSAAGVSGGPLAELITKAAKAEKPEDVAAFVGKYAALAGKPVTAPVVPVKAPIAPSDTGAPKGPGSDQLAGDPRLWPADVVDKMSVDAFRKAVREYEDVAGGKQNPFVRLRKR